MNYFIEGIQGSGKTTMLEKMTQDNPKLKAYREGDFSPVELAWCAYVSHSQYEIIIKKYANLAGEIKKNTVKEGEMYIITYTRIITDIPDFHKELEQYEIYNGLKSKAEFEEIVLSRFTSWSEDNQLFECSIFQNIIENQILYLQMNDDEIVDFYRRVKDTLKGKKYKIIYLSVDNVREAEEIIKKERSDEAGNEMWFPVMIKYLEGAPFFKAHGYIGMETSVYKGYKQDKIEMRGDRAEMSDFPLYLNTVAGGLDRRDQTIGGFSFVVKIYAVPVVEIIG
jgi:hypothetical protein